VAFDELLILAARCGSGASPINGSSTCPMGPTRPARARLLASAQRMVQEDGCAVVKLVGRGRAARRARADLRSGIAVM